jgi:hypothetical protein
MAARLLDAAVASRPFATVAARMLDAAAVCLRQSEEASRNSSKTFR